MIRDLFRALWNRLFWTTPPDCPTCGMPLVMETKSKVYVHKIYWSTLQTSMVAGCVFGCIIALIVSLATNDANHAYSKHVYDIGLSAFFGWIIGLGIGVVLGGATSIVFRKTTIQYFPCPTPTCEYPQLTGPMMNDTIYPLDNRVHIHK